MSDRSSKWTFIAYPDSVPNNWQEILKSYHIPMAISPLHDKDLNPTDEEKKAHWHIMLDFPTLKSYKQVAEITEQVNGTIPQVVHSPIGMVRYFIHKDNPEKHQYDWADITVYNGFDLDRYDSYTDSEIDAFISDITQFIDDNDIMEYSDLIAFTRGTNNELYHWYKIIRKNTIFFCAYINSKRNKYKEWTKQQANK